MVFIPWISGCRPQTVERPVVLVTVAPQAWIVEALADGLVDVHVLVPPGAHPGTYTPGHAAMERVSHAEVYLNLGSQFHFERMWMGRIRDLNPELRVFTSDEQDRSEDPHLWTGFEGARRLARTAHRGLAETLPGRDDVLQERLELLLNRIGAKEAAFRTALEGQAGKRFYVFHPAWSALAREFGLEQVSIEEHGKEPSARRLADLVDQARRDGVRFILVQPQFSQQGARAVARAANAEVLFVDPLLADWERGMDDLLQALTQGLVEPHRP